jgi:hypothetical protein
MNTASLTLSLRNLVSPAFVAVVVVSIVVVVSFIKPEGRL